MIGWITRLFSPREITFENLVTGLKGKAVNRLLVETEIKAHDTTKTLGVGTLGQFDHSVLVSARGIALTEDRYRVMLFTRRGSTRGLYDERDRVDAAIRTYLYAEQYANRLQDELPGIPVLFVGPYGLLNEGAYEQIHRDALFRGIVIV